jgi:hypothetical protein
VYTKQELVSVCGLGDVSGLCGANCRHSYMAFVKGYSVRTYTPEQLRELERKEQQTRLYNGKEYTPYQASQMQRQMETKMRNQRAYVKGLQQGGASTDDVIAAKTRYLNTLHQYQNFSKKMKLPEQMERVYMDGLGRVAFGTTNYTKFIAKKSSIAIIKEKESKLKMNLQFFSEKDIKNQESNSLKRAIRKYQIRIEEHEAKISDPKVFYPEWDNYDTRYQEGLKRHWNKEIRNFRQSIQDRIEELKSRGDYHE